MANISMLESIGLFKNIIYDPKTKVINTKAKIFFKFTVTLFLLLPVIYGNIY